MTKNKSSDLFQWSQEKLWAKLQFFLLSKQGVANWRSHERKSDWRSHKVNTINTMQLFIWVRQITNYINMPLWFEDDNVMQLKNEISFTYSRKIPFYLLTFSEYREQLRETWVVWSLGMPRSWVPFPPHTQPWCVWDMPKGTTPLTKVRWGLTKTANWPTTSAWCAISRPFK